MKKIALLLVLATQAAGAWAAWVQVGASEDAVFYVDTESIVRDGQLRRFWALDDFRRKQKDDELSARVLEEIDCEARRRRFLAGSDHDGPMGTGKVLVRYDKPGDWRPIGERTTGEIKLQFVCTRP